MARAVPVVSVTTPGATLPAPIVLMVWSMAPLTTTTSGDSPSSSARAGLIGPTMLPTATISGSFSRMPRGSTVSLQ